jgi:hypothetical protein
MEHKRDLAAMDCGTFESKLSAAKQELVDVTKQLQETRLALTAALTLKGRSAAQGLLSRWKEVEAINAALSQAKLEEQALREARTTRHAEEQVSSIVEGKADQDPTRDSEEDETKKGQEQEEEYGDEDFE